MNPLVTPAWLAERLGEAGTAILDATLPPLGDTPPVDTRARYLAQHLPGAVFFDIDDLSDHSTTLPHMLPTPEEFARSMSELGVGDAMSIVLYEQEGVFSAARARWMLRTFGARAVYLLDGGLRAWVDAGLPTESGEVQRAPAEFRASLNGDAIKNFAQMQGLIAEHAQILDARSTGRFSGAVPESRHGISSGHMPGATSLPFTELVEEGRLKSAEKLCELFAARGVDLHRPITTSCGSGVTAAILSLGLGIVGAEDVTLYDGSWAEYAQRPEAVIEKSS